MFFPFMKDICVPNTVNRTILPTRTYQSSLLRYSELVRSSVYKQVHEGTPTSLQLKDFTDTSCTFQVKHPGNPTSLIAITEKLIDSTGNVVTPVISEYKTVDLQQLTGLAPNSYYRVFASAQFPTSGRTYTRTIPQYFYTHGAPLIITYLFNSTVSTLEIDLYPAHSNFKETITYILATIPDEENIYTILREHLIEIGGKIRVNNLPDEVKSGILIAKYERGDEYFSEPFTW